MSGEEMSTLTDTDRQKISDYLAGRHIPAGIGTEESACSIAAINLALNGKLSDDIPACMSSVIGRWIIVVQDAMPDEMRNSAGWRTLLPLAAGTGRDPGDEAARLEIVMEWMWGTVLPYIQPIADARGFGAVWRAMCEQRSAEAAEAAAEAARAAARAAAQTEAAAWATFDPCGLLARLVGKDVANVG